MAKAKTPAKKAPAKKAPAKKVDKQRKLPPLFKELKAGKMTEKKLMGMRDKKGFISFLLTYPLGFLLGSQIDTDVATYDQPIDKVMSDAEAAACPSDQWQLTDTDVKPYAANPKKETVTLLVSTKVEPVPAAVVVDHLDDRSTGTETMRVEHGPGVMTEVPRAFDPTTVDKGGLPRIKAHVSADNTPNEKVAFDATLWFEQATDAEIRQLARDQWGNEVSSDKIAEFMQDHDPDVKKLLDSVDNTSTALDAGSSVEVDKDLALDWIANHRAHLSDDIAAIENGDDPAQEADAEAAKKPA